jgi:hypothetical protein
LCVAPETLMQGIANVLDLEIRRSMNMACYEAGVKIPMPTSKFDTALSIWFYGFMKTTIEMSDDSFGQPNQSLRSAGKHSSNSSQRP